MQAQWLVRLAVFAGAVPLMGVWCVCAWWWLDHTLGPFNASSLGLIFLVGLLVFGGIVFGANWAIRGPWWFRVPAVMIATLAGTIAFALSMGLTMGWLSR